MPLDHAKCICQIGRRTGTVPLECLFPGGCRYNCMEKHKMTTVNTQLERVSGLLDTKDLSDWEQDFVENVWSLSRQGKRPDLLSAKQLESLERIFKKHFAA